RHAEKRAAEDHPEHDPTNGHRTHEWSPRTFSCPERDREAGNSVAVAVLAWSGGRARTAIAAGLPRLSMKLLPNPSRRFSFESPASAGPPAASARPERSAWRACR